MSTSKEFTLKRDDLLANMEEGFFVLDKDFVVQDKYSLALSKILNLKNPGGKPLLKLLQPFITGEDISTIGSYLDILMDTKVDDELIIQLNPLNRLEFKLLDKNDLSYSKYLTFCFKRVKKGNRISAALVTVLDETEAYLLNKKIKETEENFKKQLDWLTSIIQIDRKILREFISSAYFEIEEIVKYFKYDGLLDYYTILEHISRSLHLVKGNANLLDFTFFAQRLHALEEIAITVKQKEEINSNDFLPLIFGVQNLKDNLDGLGRLLEKLTSMDFQNNVVREQTMLESIRKMVTRISFELKKDVTFDDEGFKPERIPPQYLFVVKNILIQMVKNSLSHGIETPKVRKENNKDETGLIRITNALKGNKFFLKYYDDGRGLQLEKLKARALETGKWDEKVINGWDKEDLSGVIFNSGISSSDNSTLIEGRGFGMNLIKNQIEKFNGTIEVKSEEYEFCEFTITLPLTHEN
jgi:chemotaxis protein histidine kinase CheA